MKDKPNMQKVYGLVLQKTGIADEGVEEFMRVGMFQQASIVDVESTIFDEPTDPQDIDDIHIALIKIV
jgi:hypothetical protein